ncbi:MAG: protein kinase, partial [Chloroflexi bacterium]|nr:protein kinase [Chloroflexota bacterium]
MTLNTGQIVDNRYRIVSPLGQGGMGAVYRAWDTRLNQPVALKEMIPQSGLDVGMLAQLRQQFQQEAQVLAALVHPNLVRVTDYFSWSSNEYLVMDFVEGESLAERIEREGAQSEAQVLAWAEQLLNALTHCHERGVIHRDVKPQNIVVTPDGRAVLVDFGLVKLWDPRDPRTRTVMRGAGTPEYAPPEQYDMGLGHTDPRSDIYSLGATLYHALTGQAPPTATQRMASPACFVPPRRVNAAVSPATETSVLKAMETAMEHRFQSAEEMAQVLVLAPQPALITPRRVTPTGTQVISAAEVAAAKPPQKRKRGILLGLGGVGLAVVGLLCLVLAVGAVLIGSVIMDGGGVVPATPTPWPTVTSRPPTATLPSATSSPRPTSTPAPEIGRILFQDDFSDQDSGWEVGDYDTGSVGYKSSAYFVTSAGDDNTMWGVANRSFDDLFIEVDTTQISSPANNNNDYGVVCREQGDGA